MCAVDKLFQAFFGDQQHLVKQEEGSLLLHSVHLEGPFQHQFSKTTEVWPSPVHQQGLNFLLGEKSETETQMDVSAVQYLRTPRVLTFQGLKIKLLNSDQWLTALKQEALTLFLPENNHDRSLKSQPVC